MAELLQTGHPIRDRELIFERPDGSRLTILANLDPLRDETGKLVGRVNCFQDITARKVAEQRLQQRERWCRDLLEALPAAIYTTDADGRITFYNEAAAELCDRRPVVGNDAWSIAGTLYWPDGKPIAHDECPMALALKTGKPVRGTRRSSSVPTALASLSLRFLHRCTMTKAS
jgi:PAS domain-containing protein